MNEMFSSRRVCRKTNKPKKVINLQVRKFPTDHTLRGVCAFETHEKVIKCFFPAKLRPPPLMRIIYTPMYVYDILLIAFKLSDILSFTQLFPTSVHILILALLVVDYI